MSRELKKGEAVKVNNETYIGEVVPQSGIPANTGARKQSRKVEEYKGDPPSHDGKLQMVFPITEACGVDGCKMKLNVVRIKNVKLEHDSTGIGFSLKYDEDDVKCFKQCPIHGPDPAQGVDANGRPNRW